MYTLPSVCAKESEKEEENGKEGRGQGEGKRVVKRIIGRSSVCIHTLACIHVRPEEKADQAEVEKRV